MMTQLLSYLSCGGVVNNQIKKRFIAEFIASEKKLKSVSTVCGKVTSKSVVLMHFARLANTLLKHEESARDNHVLAGKLNM